MRIPRRSKSTSRARQLLGSLPNLLDASAGGIQISGDSGTGKSSACECFLQELARRGTGFCHIDPHGDNTANMERFCAGLPDRIRRKVRVIHPANTTQAAGVNPLFVPADGIDPFTWEARLAKKVGHVAHILISAWGEAALGFTGRPVLAKLTTLYLEILARAGLTIPDVRHFFDVKSPIYHALSLVTPDIVARADLAELAEMRPKDREELIASTKNRFLGLLKNPVVETGFGKIGSVLDARQLIQDGNIVLINLEAGDVLRDEDREIFANVWLAEFLFAAYSTPKHLRKPYVICIDELPVFARASGHLLTEALRQTRKFRLHFLCAHQGSPFFPERADDRLLRALIGQCRVHVFFRHADPIDAKLFGEVVKLPSLDVRAVKHVQTQPMQFQDGHDIVVLTDEGENWSDADQQGGSSADATSSTTTTTTGTNRSATETTKESLDLTTLRETVGRARADATGASNSTASASGRTSTTTASWSSTHSKGGSRTRKQTLVPRIVLRDVVTSIQFLTTEDQVMKKASEIASFDTGVAIVYIAGQGAYDVRFPLPKDPFRRTPKFARRKLAELRRFMAKYPEFATPAQISAERQAFLARLVAHLEALPHRTTLQLPGAERTRVEQVSPLPPSDSPESPLSI